MTIKILYALPLLLFTGLFSQAQVTDPQLQAAVERETGWIPVLITLNKQLNTDSIVAEFNAKGISVKERPKRVKNACQQIAYPIQNKLFDWMDTHAVAYRNSQSMFIINMIAVEMKAEGILSLIDHEDIRHISLNRSPYRLIAPVEPAQPAPRASNSSEPGLSAIGAPQMWALGYSGRGRLAYSVDTGIWPDHPALKRQWKGHRFPLAESWLPWDLEFPGDKPSSHGTHTTGTILGLDTAQADTIGLAFNAYFIATDPVVSNSGAIRPLSDYVITYQWCLDPDGNPETTSDVPDAINNSWGRGPSEDSPFCDEDMTQMLLVLEAAGIANVSSAGNEGPGPQTMSVPHNINSNEVNAFTVGSVNGNSPSLPISDFSSRGPSQCDATGSLLIKPEVSAPGQNVRSAVGQDEYANFSGTSMACPHAVGAVLLLKEAYPFLPGRDLLEALYYSATDLGEPGEDNTYGMGIINVYDAFLYLQDMGHTPSPPFVSDFDLVITDVVSPVSNAICENSFTPSIRVKNFGAVPVSGFNIVYGILGETEIVDDYDEILNPGEEAVIVLPEYQTTSAGFVEMKFKVNPYDIAEEQDLINNQIFARFSIKTEETVSYSDDFDSTPIDRARWHIENPDNEITWEQFELPGSELNQCMRVNLADYSPRASQPDELVGPQIETPGQGSLFLAFDLAYQLRTGPPTIHDSLQVYIATACNDDEPLLVYNKGGEALSTWEINTPEFVPQSPEQWRREVIDLTEFAGQEYIIPVFRSINRRGNNLYIDNIAVYQDNDPLTVASQDDFNAVIFPNPTSGDCRISWQTGEVIHSIVILDSAGRLVHQQASGANSAEVILPSGNLSKGIYFVQMKGQSALKTLKMIVN